MSIKKKSGIRITSAQIVVLGFLGLILLGALLLMLPIASKERVVTPFLDTMFTATSAVCVTGLIVKDTATYWSAFGQGIILFLIQIGGLGVVMMAVLFTTLAGKSVSLSVRGMMQDTVTAPRIDGIVKITGFIFKGTLLVELAGALLMMPVMITKFGARGIWMSIFHSISAFCNAGFDLMGTPESKFQSLTSFASDPYMNVVIMLLIVIGGIGFLTWEDVVKHKFHFRKYRLQSKVILVTSGVLILLPAIWFFFTEYNELGMKDRVLLSLFQSVTTRTAGFNTGDYAAMSGKGIAISVFLMLIGGSPGSTAGGLKTTTVAVLVANIVAVFKRRENPRMFGRRIDDSAIKSAATLVMMYTLIFLVAAMFISAIEGISMSDCMFETASAIGTVGLTVGITPTLGTVSHVILMCMMFFGRVGILTMVYAAVKPKQEVSKLPLEKIAVG